MKKNSVPTKIFVLVLSAILVKIIFAQPCITSIFRLQKQKNQFQGRARVSACNRISFLEIQIQFFLIILILFSFPTFELHKGVCLFWCPKSIFANKYCGISFFFATHLAHITQLFLGSNHQNVSNQLKSEQKLRIEPII